MKAVNTEERTTLLLNQAWAPVTAITARVAFLHLLKKKVTIIGDDGVLYKSFEAWNSESKFPDDQPCIRSQKTSWPIPSVVIVTSKFFHRPRKKKLSLPDLAKLYGGQCQYCLRVHPLSDLTIDHIKPRSKGGTDDHSNRTLACRKCNTTKSSHYPYTNILDKPVSAPPIPETPVNAFGKIRPAWEKFLAGRI
jgi:5-methylcytosine-specific restriction endonuclease McrA